MPHLTDSEKAEAMILKDALARLKKGRRLFEHQWQAVKDSKRIPADAREQMLSRHMVCTLAHMAASGKLNAFDIRFMREHAPEKLPVHLRASVKAGTSSAAIRRHTRVTSAVGVAYIPHEQLVSTAEWCERNIYLSPRIPTSQPGWWRRSSVPALVAPGGITEALDDATAETVVVMKGSQTALTTTAYCWLAKEIATEPSSALIVMNSASDARDKSAESWKPIWEDSRGLRGYIPQNRRNEWTKLYQCINTAPVYWIGANSPGRLGAKPIRRLILDEVDKYPQGFGRKRRGTVALSSSEAGAVALAKQRTKAFRKNGLAKIVEFSTPTDEHGEIATAYAEGDQRKLYVKCPMCDAEQIMVWKNFKIDMELAKTNAGAAINAARYECPNCKKGWTDKDRWEAIGRGEWRATAIPRDPKCRSFHLPSWCSVFVTTQYLAAQWVKARENRSALQDFINSECADPFVHHDNSIKDSMFSQLEGEYEEGELWTEKAVYKAQLGEDVEAVVFAGCDVQKGYLVPVFRQFTRGGDSGLIWAGDCANFEALDKLAERFNAQFIVPDMRYRTREVQEWAFRHPGYIPAAGVTRKSKSLFAVQSLDLDEGRSSGKGRKIEVLDFDGNMLKDMLAGLIQRDAGAPRWLIPQGFGRNKTYTEQMSAERRIAGLWVNPQGKANHLWDAEVLCLLAAIRFGFFGQQEEVSN